jgi:PAS domain S-box-containing protein
LAEERLRDSETRLRLAVDAAHMAVWESDVRTGAVRGSPQLNRLLGFADDEPLELEKIRARYLPGERERVAEAGKQALRHPERFGEVEFRYCPPGEGLRWLLLRAQVQVDGDGEPLSFIGVMMDITQRKRAEEHQLLLVNELNHRVKNTLAIVQGIAHQSFKGTSLSQEARQAFEGRLSALSTAHNLLTHQNWEAASIHQIIRDGVGALGLSSNRVMAHGPELLLVPQTAVSLAMAIHELATNAVKYGSLSRTEGIVDVKWHVQDERLKLQWQEHGGPPVVAPAKRGFGTRMIEAALASELSGTVTIEFNPTGLICTIDAPTPRA